MIRVQGDYALHSFALSQRSFAATVSVLVLFAQKIIHLGLQVPALQLFCRDSLSCQANNY